MADAGYRLAVEGEAEFRQALKSISDEIKVSRSEMKLLTEEYNLNNQNLGALAEKSKVLENAIGQQSQKVELLRGQYEKAAQALGEHDSRTQALKVSLNNEQTALVKLNAELKANEEKIRAADAADGELAAALNDVNNRLAENETALKEASSALGTATASADQLRAKNDLLTQGIGLQKEKIDALNAALADSEKKYGKGSDQAEGYRREISKAETEMSKMTSELGKNKEALDKTTTSGGSLKDMFSDIQDQLGVKIPDGITGMIGGIDLATAGAGALAGAFAGVAKVVADSAINAAELADDLETRASVSGIDTTTLQELEYMAPFIDVDVSTIEEAVKKVTKLMGEAKDGAKNAQEAFGNLGVGIYDENGNLRKAIDVFYDVIDGLRDIHNNTERDAASMKVFGENAGELNPLIYAGAETMKYYAQQAHEVGYVLEDETLGILTRFQTHMDEVGQSFKGFFRNLGAEAVTLLGLFNGSTTVEDYKKIGEKRVDSFHSLIKSIFKKYATGTFNAPAGWALVGEKGPELVELPAGAAVYPNGTVPDRFGGTQNTTYNISINAADVREFNDIVRIARQRQQSTRMGWTGGR